MIRKRRRKVKAGVNVKEKKESTVNECFKN